MASTRRTFLVVAAAPFLREYFTTLFPGDRVLTAGDVPEATQLMARTPDLQALVVEDDDAGWELVAHGRLHRPEVPRVMLSAQKDEQRVLVALQRGEVFRFIMQPLTTLDILQTLHQAAQTRAQHHCPTG